MAMADTTLTVPVDVAQILFDQLELSRVGNPYKRVTQVQITPDWYSILLQQLGVLSTPPGEVLTVFGVPVVVLHNQPAERIQLVYGLTS